MRIVKMNVVTEKNRSFSPPNPSRLEYLDVMRGLAVLGILIANLEWFSFYSGKGSGTFFFPSLDHLFSSLHHVFIEGKFYSIFSILFGWGMAMQLGQVSSSKKTILRRLTCMVAFGLLHLLLLWEGDIVFLYGLLGFMLFFLSTFSNLSLLVCGLFLLAAPVLINSLRESSTFIDMPVTYLRQFGRYLYHLNGLQDQHTDRTLAFKINKNILMHFRLTMADSPYRIAYLLESNRIPRVLGLMLLGLVAGRSGIYYKMIGSRERMIWVALCLFIFSFPFNFLLNMLIDGKSGDSLMAINETVAYALGVVPMAVFYMITIALIHSGGIAKGLWLWIIPVGKMAFSNYILQTLLGIFLFYGIGLGLMDSLGPFMLTISAIVIFSFQVLISKVYMRFFKYGPIEYIWRCLTYGKILSIRPLDTAPMIENK